MTCNAGTKTRTRLCNNPSPSGGGSSCSGISSQSTSCNNGACPGIEKLYQSIFGFQNKDDKHVLDILFSFVIHFLYLSAPCSSNPCQNGGTCSVCPNVNLCPERWTCQCQPHCKGRQCEICKPTPKPSSNKIKSKSPTNVNIKVLVYC